MSKRRTRSARKRCKRCGAEDAPHRKFVRNGKSRVQCQCRQCEADAAGARHKRDPFNAEKTPWRKMRERCNAPGQHGYARYGGRGVTVCARWDQFESFLEDMGTRPSSEHSIDRIDNNGDYEPNNCCWASRSEQQSNTSRNRLLTYRGVTLTMAEWARRLGMNIQTLHMRLTSAGWSVEKALSTPVKRKGKGS